MKKMISVVIVGSFLIGSLAIAQEIHVTRGRQPTHETRTHDRYIKYDRSTGDGTIHFMNKTKIRRRYGEKDRYGKRRRGCTDEKGRRVKCR